jgi:hypothetical protein
MQDGSVALDEEALALSVAILVGWAAGKPCGKWILAVAAFALNNTLFDHRAL